MASQASQENRDAYKKQIHHEPGHCDESLASVENCDAMEKQGTAVIDPFGESAGEGGTNYRSLKWWQAGSIMVAETVSIGILSLPSVLATLGFATGMLVLIGLGIATWYTGYVIGQFKGRYPHVHNFADAGGVLLGRVGHELFDIAQLVFLVFICGSHILTFSIAMNALTNHGMCTLFFSVIGALAQFILSLPRTLKNMSHLSIVSFISISAAVGVTMVAVGVQRPNTTTQAFADPPLVPAFLGAMNIIFAYAGHVAYFGFISELEDPRTFPKALAFLQISDMVLYMLSAAIIYAFAGNDVRSPALSSTGVLLAKIAYGVALPTIIISGVINGHVGAKNVYVRLFRGTKFMAEKSFRSYGVWTAILAAIWTVAWVIASAIPVFNDLLGLISALFASWFTFGLTGIFWLYMNWGQWTKNWKKMFLTLVNMCMFAIGVVTCFMGLWASASAISMKAASGVDKGKAAFSCANNAA